MAETPIPWALSCRRCSLRTSSACHRVVLGTGPLTAKTLLIGEAPGREEDLSGIPFIGQAGQYLRDILTAVGIDPSTVYISNAVKCRPVDNEKPKPGHIAACRGWLAAEIEAIRPSLIVCLGDTAAKALWGSGVSHQYKVPNGVGKKGQQLYKEPTLTDLRRRDDLTYQAVFTDVDDAGRTRFEEVSIPTLVAFHPSAAMQYERYRSAFLRDMVRLAETLGIRPGDNGLSTRKYIEVSPNLGAATLASALLHVQDCITTQTISLDTEFDRHGRLHCYSFTATENSGYVVYADASWSRDLLRRIVEAAPSLVMHSAQADVPVICRETGISLDAFPWHKVHDTAVMAYVLGKRPIALKTLAENELGLKVLRLEDFLEDYDFSTADRATVTVYSVQDADITLRLFNRFAAELALPLTGEPSLPLAA